jgi:5-(carboxyamino)imidazole ribonucleotide synthase
LTNFRVGVIGGGQLARMMIAPANNLGIEIKVLAESANSSAAIATTMVGDFTDQETVSAFAKTVDVITFDHEHVPLEILRELEQEGVSVQPPSRALAHAQNKLVMRKALEKIGAPNPIWAEVSSSQQLDNFIAQHGPEVIVKTPIGGYDGKGVRVVSSSEQVSDWLAEPMISSLGGSLLVEQKVKFNRELAQLSARNPAGEFVSWPLVETRQRNGVCSEVLSPAPELSSEMAADAVEIAKLISQSLEVTGNLAVEMFETSDGQLLVNELAMRPHNSGHFTIEVSRTSQFEQHLRAVLNLPLGKTDALVPAAVMANLLGLSDSKDFMDNYEKVMIEFPQIKIHSYGKAPRLGRKLGHVTVCGDDLAKCLSIAEAARDELNK